MAAQTASLYRGFVFAVPSFLSVVKTGSRLLYVGCPRAPERKQQGAKNIKSSLGRAALTQSGRRIDVSGFVQLVPNKFLVSESAVRVRSSFWCGDEG